MGKIGASKRAPEVPLTPRKPSQTLTTWQRKVRMEQLSFDDVEVWKPVVGWEGLYTVSSLGRVKSFCDHGRWKTGPEGRLLTINYNIDNGYAYVRLSRNGTSTPRTVHSLVLEAFVGPCPEGMECRHPGVTVSGQPAPVQSELGHVPRQQLRSGRARHPQQRQQGEVQERARLHRGEHVLLPPG